jgi:hypothetical protein
LAENVFKDECSDKSHGFVLEGSSFRISGERASGMNEEMEAVCSGEEHGVNVYTVEKWSRGGNNGGNEYLLDLMCLTHMACLDKPFDILAEQGPPKVAKNAGQDNIYSLVSKGVMGFSEDGKSTVFQRDELVASIGSLMPKLVVENKEVRSGLYKVVEMCFVKFWRAAGVAEE